ncbi:phage portal protein [Ihubacter sp. rT4E-8]|uniref:phage portal protein n=1 Tax=Ihubacter sp. rT4E-8 TaxID=3242369 RepID=UPI003CFB4FE0
MLTAEEIRQFLEEDEASMLKKRAREGQRYYDGNHDILDYRMFYWNADGILVEDNTRANAKIPHMFFTELCDQATQHILSGDEGIFRTDIPELQEQLDLYFNKNEVWMSELSETITGLQVKGFDYMYAYNGKDDRLQFENADSIGVVEVEGRFADDGKDQRIWKYIDRVDKDGNTQWKILVIDDKYTYYWKQTNDGEIIEDNSVEVNPKPHKVYQKKGSSRLFIRPAEYLPFFRADFNKKKISHLYSVKTLIDDYDLMSSSLTNNLIDFDTPIHVVRGYQGDDLTELQTNLKTKKIIGVEEDGGVEVHTVNVPYEARKAKMEMDEKNIYRFGMGLNMQGLKDTSATTNIAIKAAYSLLDLRCSKIIIQIKKMLREILRVVIDEINSQRGTDYQPSQVWFNFEPEIMSNAQENAQIKLTEAQTQQILINVLLGLADRLDDETLMQQICDCLDLDYNEIKGKLPDPNENVNSLTSAIDTVAGGLGE